ncbi:MAG: helix-turn-helix transcriptional regulator [Thermoleophilaceae bacterium]|nr:helix-turn-helix transcriptional regulator [Thermoleophilaceae bacterium]
MEVTPPKDFLRPCLLLLLREHPAHGYDLLERTQAFGFKSSDPGRLYRALRALERDGLVHSTWEVSDTGPDRRIYQLTRPGMEELHRRVRAIAGTRRLMDAFLGRYEEFVALARESEPRRASR